MYISYIYYTRCSSRYKLVLRCTEWRVPQTGFAEQVAPVSSITILNTLRWPATSLLLRNSLSNAHKNVSTRRQLNHHLKSLKGNPALRTDFTVTFSLLCSRLPIACHSRPLLCNFGSILFYFGIAIKLCPAHSQSDLFHFPMVCPILLLAPYLLRSCFPINTSVTDVTFAVSASVIQHVSRLYCCASWNLLIIRQ